MTFFDQLTGNSANDLVKFINNNAKYDFEKIETMKTDDSTIIQMSTDGVKVIVEVPNDNSAVAVKFGDDGAIAQFDTKNPDKMWREIENFLNSEILESYSQDVLDRLLY